MRDRSGDVMPSWNSDGNVDSTREGSPSARRPFAVMPTLIAEGGLAPAAWRLRGHRRDEDRDGGDTAELHDTHARDVSRTTG